MDGEMVGAATVAGASASVLIRTDGPCLTGTLRTLGAGPKAMSPEALVKIKSDALEQLSQIVADYTTNVAAGEVGSNGSGRATSVAPKGPCTGLLYGRIQSGKTVAMIGLVSAAIDNGFRVVVVLTSDNVKLVSQTTERFGAIEGPIALDALNPRAWIGDDKHISKHLGRSGIVFVCSKNKTRLDNLIEFLEKIGAPEYPALILDDEADQASPDTNLARSSRAQAKGQPRIDSTVIHAQVADELRETLRHHVFLQVTATPYVLLLQSVGTQLRPSFTRLLEPGIGYTGGESFFEDRHVDGPEPPLVFVPKDESAAILEGATDAPDGLRQAIAFFLLAAATQSATDPDSARVGQNFLCHTSQLRKQHSNLEGLVRAYVDRISDALDAGKGEGLDRLRAAYLELGRTVASPPAFEVLVEHVRRGLVNRKVVVVNAEADAEAGKGLNFIVGGNILGRGVTIDNLLVTYYLREPKIGQMDTMLQHARMYGYRAKLMHLTRVFLPEQLAVRFHEIHGIEKRLRGQLMTADLSKQVLIEKTSTLNPTRRAALDPTYIDAFEPSEQIYPSYPDLGMSKKEYEQIHKGVQRLLGGQIVEKDARPIDFDEMLGLLESFPYDTKEGSSRWVPHILRRVLERQRERCGGRAYLYVRRITRTKPYFSTGATSGAELAALRAKDGPVLCAFRDDGTGLSVPPFWYPTLILDRGMPNLIVNVTSDE